jgi:hypothetical protein
MMDSLKTLLILLFIFFTNVLKSEVSIDLPLLGKGIYTWYFLDLYEANLWSQSKEDIFANPLMLELSYRRSFKGNDIADQSIKELIQARVELNDLSYFQKELHSIFPDVDSGDSILAKYSPQAGIVFYKNRKDEIGRISNLKYSKLFLEIWLGEKTTAKSLREKLLGIKK